MKPADVTPVVFRVWRESGDVIALFPAEDADVFGRFCNSYEHVGQHGGADYGLVISYTRPAKPEEYATLKKELESPPYEYRFKVYRRWSRGRVRA